MMMLISLVIGLLIFSSAIPAANVGSPQAIPWLDEWVMNHAKYRPPSSPERVLPGRYLIEFSTTSFSPLSYFQQVHEKAVSHYAHSARFHGNNDDSFMMQLNMTVYHTYGTPDIFYGASIHFQLDDDDMDDSNDNENISINSGSRGNDSASTQQQQHQYHITKRATYQRVLKSFFAHQAINKIYPVTIIDRPEAEGKYRRAGYNISQHLPPDLGSLGVPFHLANDQLSRAREAGLWGQGITVGIVDSGVDYYHPALGGGFGPGYTVALGYDYVGDHFTVNDPSSREEHPTPLDTCGSADADANGHGTHVTGIIAADDKRYNFTGVAPKATIGMWRVFSCTGSTTSDLVIKGLMAAYESGCDVINLSLGGPSSWAEETTALIADKIAAHGVLVVAAAGNDGDQGAFYTSSPATGERVFSVSSLNNNATLLPTLATLIGQQKRTFAYQLSSSTDYFPNGTLIAYNLVNDHYEEACEGSEPDHPLMQDAIVLVRRGNCTYDEKARVAAKAGAIAMLIYDPFHPMAFAPTTTESGAPIPVAAVSGFDGIALYDELMELSKRNDSNNGSGDVHTDPHGLVVSFNTLLSLNNVSSGGFVSSFSSVGPTNDLALKPNLAGIGGFVFSTLPLALGGYGILSGTSMASPFVAGCLALYLQAQEHGKHHHRHRRHRRDHQHQHFRRDEDEDDNDDEKARMKSKKHSVDARFVMEQFMNYASPSMLNPFQLDPTISNTLFDNPARQGAGLVQVADTIDGTIHISAGQLEFSDDEHRQPRNVTITNHGSLPADIEILDQQPSVSLAPYNLSRHGYAPQEPVGMSTVRATLSITVFMNNKKKNKHEVSQPSNQSGNGISRIAWKLAPKQSITIQVHVSSIDNYNNDSTTSMTLAQASNATNLPYPVFGGYLRIRTTAATTTTTTTRSTTDDPTTQDGKSLILYVPYVGVQGNVRDLPMFAPGYPTFIIDRQQNRQKQHPLRKHEIAAPLSSSIVVRLLTGTAIFMTEVWVYDPAQQNATQFYGYANIHTYLPRHTLTKHPISVFPWNGSVLVHPPKLPKDTNHAAAAASMADWQHVNNDENEVIFAKNATSSFAKSPSSKTTRPVQPGTYILHWKALKLLADPSLASSWEIVTSNPFEITPAPVPSSP